MAALNTPTFPVNTISSTPPLTLFRSERDRWVEFEQAVASTQWIIPHYLYKMPTVTVIADGVTGVLLGDIVHTNKNELVINFSVAYSGIAFLN